MNVRLGCLMASVVALSLAACGGGSDNSSTPQNNQDGGWLTFYSANRVTAQYQGESASVVLTATASRTFAAPFNVAVIDSSGVISPDVQISAVSPVEYRATLRTSATLASGEHSTMLEVRLCEDTPTICARPLPGSPWRVPLKVQVKSAAEAKARLTLAKPSVSLTTYPGDRTVFSIEAQLNKETIGKSLNIGVFDPSSMTIAPAGQTTSAPDGRYVFDLSTATSSALALGTHTGNLELRLCQDDVRVCRQPMAGSPWIVPLSVNLLAPTNLTSLTAVDGLGAWSTYQGNPAHTGHVAASFDPAAFSRRWKVASQSDFGGEFVSAAIDSGRAFFVRREASGRWELIAVSEDTGEQAWKVDLGTLRQVNPPAAANGRVYLTSTGHKDTFFWVYDQVSGKLLKQQAMISQWPNYSAPTVLGTDVYTISGYNGGISKYADAQGRFSWDGQSTASDGWSPSTDGRFVYLYSTPDNILRVLDAANGSSTYSIGERYPYSTSFSASAVVLTDTRQAIVGGAGLTVFDLDGRKRSWTQNASATGTPAYGNGTIYAFGANGHSLEARAPATGNLLWTAPIPESSVYTNVIVTRNLAFVSSKSRTHAIDLATKKVVWTYPMGGSLAISARGVLYVLSSVGDLAAVNLR
ncbi:PQQ-binding-like beta-propeller repeat protein [Massilia violaceinigra]|uniref:PQQ-binding-like beta-propeller repeat protein n=1 Tax=Massilia violaceinigra TaxID=2045208 RepID=A0ABY4A3Y9_9BURK|nr:PQQ-binding-like beta-propeller repeat protein [Massilia violaceinigra]UOD29485.1 PQQ-binding-like beta-propeller repeat protein [Massilia violaceinigra]